MNNSKQYRSLGMGIAMLAGTLIAPAQAAETDITVIGGVALQEKSLEFTLNNFKVSSRQNTASYSLGAAARGGYVLLEVDRPFGQYDTTEMANGGQSLVEFQVERSDYSLTIGYNVWRGLGVFGGYKIGETDVKIIQTDTAPVSIYSWLYNYREEGFFAGASYGFDFGSRGLLGLSVAYADFPTRRTAKFGALVNYIDGTVSGTSYGIRWSGALAGRVDYVVGYKLQLYRFEDETTSPLLPQADTDQDYKIFYVGLSRAF